MSEIFETYKNFTSPIKTSMVIAVVLIIISIVMGIKFKKADPLKTPKGLMFLIYNLVEFIDNFTIGLIGKGRYKSFSPYLLMLVLYLVPAVFLGFLGFTSPLVQPVVTISLGFATYTFVVVGGIRFKGFIPFLRGFKEPVILFLPMNIIGEISKPFSLGIRIFGNIISGVIIMSLIYGVTSWFAPVIAPFGHAVFDIFMGTIQIIVFVLLSAVFISLAVGDEEEEELQK